MKPVLFLLAVVTLGWLVAILAIAALIFFGSLVAWVVIILRSVGRKEKEQIDRRRLKRLVEQEQT